MITLNQTESDDPKFIELINQILNGVISCHQPNQIYLIQIDHWFDFKWLFFSGVPFPQVGAYYSDILRLPPFEPNRVMSQFCFKKESASEPHYKFHQSKPLQVHQSSYRNLHKRLNQPNQLGLYIWYSGDTQKTGRGCLMVYWIEEAKATAWYISFLKDKNQNWKFNKSKNISQKEISDFVKISASSQAA
jgi:hypothetical protein